MFKLSLKFVPLFLLPLLLHFLSTVALGFSFCLGDPPFSPELVIYWIYFRIMCSLFWLCLWVCANCFKQLYWSVVSFLTIKLANESLILCQFDAPWHKASQLLKFSSFPGIANLHLLVKSLIIFGAVSCAVVVFMIV